MGELHPGRVFGFVPLLVVLLLGAAGWEVGEAGGELMMGQVERQLSAGLLECGGDSKGAGCFSDEEEFALDSETNRMLQSGAAYLSNLLLKKDGVPCRIPGRSYTSCGSPARSVYKYNRCSGTCLRFNI
ncbi:rapid alkalinization factor-like [Nymphaea colorata]|uniref:rapid alkalinization factor-like n=1 Tax=Nymphaea colorata TaxID=210225 RepID=UPI00129E8C51|nr:rapid alkalinization factor-like [Nymphaea colorata]